MGACADRGREDATWRRARRERIDPSPEACVAKARAYHGPGAGPGSTSDRSSDSGAGRARLGMATSTHGFPSLRDSAWDPPDPVCASFPLTAARQSRIHTGFPFSADPTCWVNAGGKAQDKGQMRRTQGAPPKRRTPARPPCGSPLRCLGMTARRPAAGPHRPGDPLSQSLQGACLVCVPYPSTLAGALWKDQWKQCVRNPEPVWHTDCTTPINLPERHPPGEACRCRRA
jgi:hypothetical protein